MWEDPIVAEVHKVRGTLTDRPAAVISYIAGMDEEQLRLSTSDKFWKLMTERRGQKAIGRAELEQRLKHRSANT